MQNLKRNINMGFRVTPQEQELIRQRIEDAGFSSVRAYMLKMALNGMIVNLDLTDVRECSRLLRYTSNNINQIAKKANEMGGVSQSDITYVQEKMDAVWQQQDKIIKSLTKLLEVV